jgi:hypothetical protein
MSIIELSPKKFVARKTTSEFVLFSDYLIIILMAAVFLPGVALIYLAMHGRAVLGSVGLACWLLVLAWSLIQFHNRGFIRPWLSASLVIFVYAAFALTFAYG